MMTKIEELFKNYYKTQNFSGAALIKKGDNILLQKAYGYAHRGFKVKNAIDTKFDTASVTKLFTAVSVLQLVDRGLLSLDAKITDLLDLKGTKIPADVTIRHLLTHSSGIADDADEEAGEKYEDLFIDKPNYSIRQNKDLLPQFVYKEPNFKAGTEIRYNNCAFVLLGLVVEQVSGVSYDEYVTDNIFKVCKMTRSGFNSKDDADSDIAEGYFDANENDETMKWTKNIYSYPPVGTADGGAITTVSDLDLFMRSILSEKLLSKSLTKEILTPQIPIEKKYDWGKIMNGFGFHFLYDNQDKLMRIYKEGSNPGVGAMFAYYPSIDTTSIILANQTCDIWRLHWEVEQNLIDDV